MEDKKTTELEVENQVESQDSLNASSQTDEVTNEQDVDSGDVEKQEGEEENPYAVKLKQLEEQLAKEKADREAEKKKQQEIVEHKNRALQAEKAKNKKLDTSSDEDLDTILERKVQERLKPLEDKIHNSEVDKKINSITTDDSERKLIKHLYDNSIVKTGNIDRDITLAVGAANAEVTMQLKKDRLEQEGHEEFLVKFQSASKKSSSASNTIKDPIKRAAADLVSKIDPRAVKFLE